MVTASPISFTLEHDEGQAGVGYLWLALLEGS